MEHSRLSRYEAHVYLVSCVSQKLSTEAKAQDLYISPLFRKARAYVEKTSQRWYILSAKYGLVHPETVITPYDQTLNDMRFSERRAWSLGVLGQLEPHLVGVRSVVFLAGERYRQYLEPALRQKGIEVSVPMKRLPIGKQLNWLDSQLGSCS